jgi:hypothetical protein
MPIVACASVRNEIDIIEAFVRHTLAFAERLFVLDHGSTDATPDVLRSLTAEGLPLTVRSDASPGKYQSARMTALMREAANAAGVNGWVFLLDADEFLQFDGGSPIPPGQPPGRPFAIRWRTHVPHAGDLAAEANTVLRMCHCRIAPAGEEWKVVVPAALAASQGAAVEQGNHHIFVDGLPAEAVTYDRPFLAHFPIRSPGQYLAKIAVANLQYRAMADRGAGWGWHTRSAFHEILRNPASAAASFANAARRYGLHDGADLPPVICSPARYRGGRLRYTPLSAAADGPFLAVLGLAAQFADHVAARGVAPPDELGRVCTLAGRLDEEVALARRRGMQVIQLSEESVRQAERIAVLNAGLASACLAAEALRHSWTWRAGRLAVGPPVWTVRLARRLLRRAGPASGVA